MTRTDDADTGRLGVQVEVWPLAADRYGIWLVSPEGDAWRSDLLAADTEPHRAVQEVLRGHDGHPAAAAGALDAVRLVHSTSWRTDRAGGDNAVVLTYVAVLGGHGLVGGGGDMEFVRDVWSDARPLTLEVSDAVGKPHNRSPIEPPTPRYIDVLMHGVRHLRFLLDTDAQATAALDDHWRDHLRNLEPALAGMYQP